MNGLSELYSKDYTAWALHTVELLKSGCFAQLDIEHLIEELEGMGTCERNELENRLIVLLSHLLKWQFQYPQLNARWAEFDGRSWRSTINEQRARLARRLRKSPALKAMLAEVIADVYPDALALAAKETSLGVNRFPSHCPYTQEQILSDEYYPAME